MEKIVVDSIVVVKWFVVEPLSAEAQLILSGFQSGAYTLLAPDLLFAEVGNVIWKKQKFQGLAASDAQQVLDMFRQLPISVTPTSQLLEVAYRVAIDHHRSVYDSLYVALSLQEQCAFVSADEKLVNAIRPAFANVVWVGTWI